MTIAQRIGEMHRDQEINASAVEFAHVARWIALGRGQSANAIRAAQAGNATKRIVEGIKAAVEVGTTSSGTFAAPLAYQELSDGFLASLRNVGVYDAALPFSKQTPLNTKIVIVTTGASGYGVGEGQSKRVSKLVLDATGVTPRKAVSIVVASDEILRAGALGARLFSEELRRAVAVETDAQFLSVLISGVGTTASSGSNAFGIASDMAALMAGLNLGAESKVFIAMAPSDVKHMAVQIASNGERAFPTVTIHGGDYAGATIIPTDAVSGQIVAFDAAQVATAGIGVELDASNQATIQLDSAPDSPPTASTPATSFWQNNLVGLRATRYFGCERLKPSGAVSVISSVSYGSANSPA